VNNLQRLGETLPQRVAVVRALRGLGDLLCAVPAFRALRFALPNAKIMLVGLPEVQGLVERFHRYFDGLIEFPGYPGLPERALAVRQLPEFLHDVHQQQFDLALQMHGSGTISNPFTVLLGAKLTAGFFLPSEYCPDPERFLPYPTNEPEVRRHLRLMEFLGIPLQGEALEFPLQEADWRSLHVLEATRDLQPGSYACVHSGAYDPARRWPVEQFAKVADALAERGLPVVLTGSTAELPLTEAVVDSMQAPVLNLAGQTSLGALTALLSKARLLVCNDTGVSHLAAALGIPSVVIMLTADTCRWAPLNRQRHRVVDGPHATFTQVLAQVELLEDGRRDAV